MDGRGGAAARGLVRLGRVRRAAVAARLAVVCAVVRAVVCTVVWALLTGGTAAADEGPWRWPLDGPHDVSRAFAPPAERWHSGHRGADLPAEPGALVRAAAAGRVAYAGLLAGRGVVVGVHGDLRTTYEPVDAVVAVGDGVDVGEPIGLLAAGNAGCPVPACLHWGLRRGDAYLDPVRLVERGPVRLLPLGTVAGPVPAGAVVGPDAGDGPADAAPAPAAVGDGRAAARAAASDDRPDGPALAQPRPTGGLPWPVAVGGPALLAVAAGAGRRALTGSARGARRSSGPA